MIDDYDEPAFSCNFQDLSNTILLTAYNVLRNVRILAVIFVSHFLHIVLKPPSFTKQSTRH
jgi:hypothetical protein